jgi:alpha-1,4-digalacturonate transport system substrate-binding protein
MRKLVLVVFMLAALVTGVVAQDPVELHITWYDDGNEGAVLRDLLDRFEAENPDIKVVIDTVAYNVILEQLPSQVQAGEAPDIARITNFQGLVGYYLDMRPHMEDAEAFESYFPELMLGALRTPDDESEGLYGMPTQFTITGPYINRTLFEQAGVEVPSDTSDEVSWDQWIDAAKQVAEATETYALAFDRTGHRWLGAAITEGTVILDEEGNVNFDDPGFRAFAEKFKAWHDEGVVPAEVWLGSGGSYAPATEFFVNGQAVMYEAGSWQIGNFATNIGDAFDWEAIPNPTGPGGSTGMPGGAVLVAFANTEHPEEVARVFEYLAQPEVYAEFTARTLFVPGHIALPEFEYDTEDEAAAAALTVFAAEAAKLSDQAFALQFHPFFGPINTEIRERLTQYMLGEISLDEAIERAQQTVDDAIAAAGNS